MTPFHRLCAVLAAAGLAATGATAPAHADPASPAVRIVGTQVVESSPGAPIGVDLTVDLDGAPTGRLEVHYHWLRVYRDLDATSCPDTCAVHVDLDLATFEEATFDQFEPPLDDQLVATLRTDEADPAYAQVDSLTWYPATWGLAYGTAVTPDATPATIGYAPGTSDTGVSIRVSSLGSAQRPAGEVAEGRLYRPGLDGKPTGDALQTSTGSWTGNTAAVHFDTSALAEGTYVARVRARSVDGHYAGGADDRSVVVRHHPAYVVSAPAVALAGEAGRSVRMQVSGPLTTSTLADVSATATIDGTAYPKLPVVTDASSSATMNLADSKATAYVQLPASAMGVGDHDITLQLADRWGALLGPALTHRARIVDFTSQLTVVRAFVGRATPMRLVATPPAGERLTECWASAYDTRILPSWDGLCATGSTTMDRTVSWTPTAAATATVAYSLRSTGDFQRDVTVPVTVYAARTAAVRAAATAYGARGTATVALSDRSSLDAGARPAPAGVSVILQHRAAASTSWVSLATGKTGTGGTVALPYTARGNGAFRALFSSTAPGLTEASGSVTAASTATLTWTSAPTSAYRNRLTAFRVTALPYERGATASIQIRRLGATTWSTGAKVAVASTGAATVSASFGAATTYEVRVVRWGTTFIGGGYSTVRRITVR